MSKEQFISLMQNIAALGCGFAVGHGYVDANMAMLISGAVVSFAPVLYGYVSARDAALVMKAATVQGVRIKINGTTDPEVKSLATDASQPKIESEH